MTDASVVDVVNALVFVAFWGLLFIGAGSTLARVAYYRQYGYKRPRLLNRDALMIGGFATSFGIILGVRVGRSVGFDTSGLASSVVWTLITSGPAIAAVATYVYFELFVIERGTDAERDRTYLDHEEPK